MRTGSTAIPITAPNGRLDQFLGARLAHSMRGAASRDGSDHVLDLRAVPALDNDAIRAIIKIVRALRGAGRHLRVVVEDAAAHAVLRSMALDRVFRIYPTLESALTGDRPRQLLSA
jgi:anti-anti-sigma regulatory factor